MFRSLLQLTPLEFEQAVRKLLDASGYGLAQYRSEHREAIVASDGTYVFDVTVRFAALGADYLVLVECKHQGRDVERSEVQILHSKLSSVGGQKAMLFSTSGFQSGAIDYARQHGIALCQLQDECTTWFTRSLSAPPALESGEIVGWLFRGPERSLISPAFNEYLVEELRLPTLKG